VELRSREGTAAGEGERSAVAGEEVGFCVAAKLVGERARAWQIPEFPLVAHSLSPLPALFLSSFAREPAIKLSQRKNSIVLFNFFTLVASFLK